MNRGLSAWLVLLGIACAVYAPLFGGFWIGDDFSNLHLAWLHAARSELASAMLGFFGASLTPEGAFYRPLSIASLYLNFPLAGTHYAGWFAVNLGVHLGCMVMVGMLVLRLAARCRVEGSIGALLAAALFGLAPAPAEAVYWVSARADGWVTLLTLAGAVAWVGREPGPGARAAWLPVLLLPAVLFKESALVAPLQYALLALAWPGRLQPGQRVALAMALLMMAGVLVARAVWFGDPWVVYRDVGASGVGGPAVLPSALASFAPWWGALAGADVAAQAWLVLGALACAAVALANRGRGAVPRMVLALSCAAGGMLLATLLNLRGMPGGGEGGRVLLNPMAWLAVALGLGVAGAQRGRNALVALAAASAIAGALALHGIVTRTLAAQDEVRAIATAIPDWAARHPGLTLLLLPERLGAVVATNNAQGGLVLPPVQAASYIDRVLPTLPREVADRHARFANGLATQLRTLHPAAVDAAMLAAFLQPAAAAWPAHAACWSVQRRAIVPMPLPPIADAASWTSALAASAAACGITGVR